MKQSVVAYTLEKCVKCMKCIQACPVSAISMENNRIIINHERCTNCGRCIGACHSQGLVAQGSTLVDIGNYDYTVCLVPPSLTATCASKDEAERLFYGIQELGFNEVVDLSPYYGTVLNVSMNYETEHQPAIVSLCPVIDRLVQLNYPALLDHLIPMYYPAEIAAREIRDTYRDHGRVGIFNLCECEAKLTDAKYPYGNPRSEIDHALSIADVFPQIRQNLEDGRIPLHFCRDGMISSDTSLIDDYDTVLTADGFDKIINVLELAEFGRLNSFRLLYLMPCFNGCSGGHLLIGNGYMNHLNIKKLMDDDGVCSMVDDEYIWRKEGFLAEEDQRSFSEKMEFFRKVNSVLEQLPGYDCSACGMRTCRIMAEEIVNGSRSISDCHIINSTVKEETV